MEKESVILRTLKADDVARLYLDEWVLRLDKEKMQKILASKSKKETCYLSGEIKADQMVMEQGQKDVELYYFTFNNIKVASAIEIKLTHWVDYGITIRLPRLREAVSLSSWDWSLTRQPYEKR